MTTQGWKATEYASGNMTIRFDAGDWDWTWHCHDCGLQGAGGAEKPEDAMKMADEHRSGCIKKRKTG